MLKAFLVTPRLHQKTQLRKEKTVMLQIPGHPKTVIQVSNLQPFNWSCCHKANSSHIALFLLCRIRPQNSTKISQPANSKNLKNKSLQSSALNIHRNSPTPEKNHETEPQSTTCLIRWNIWKRWLLLATGAACTWEKVQYNGKASAFSSIKRWSTNWWKFQAWSKVARAWQKICRKWLKNMNSHKKEQREQANTFNYLQTLISFPSLWRRAKNP